MALGSDGGRKDKSEVGKKIKEKGGGPNLTFDDVYRAQWSSNSTSKLPLRCHRQTNFRLAQ